MNDKNTKKYTFNEVVAKEVGLEESIMFNTIYFWVDKNKKARSSYHFHKDKYWMFNSILEFAKQYPFWTVSKIRRIMKNLMEKNYIETGIFNKFGYDKTKWYTITQKGWNVASNNKEAAEIENGVDYF